jgi:phosphatidylglycerophosphate synthase
VGKLPLLLTLLRALLAPVVIALAVWWPKPWAFGLCLWLAFLSDVFDGMLARRLGVATSGLRRLDSIADSLFYLGATFAVWTLNPAAITSRTWPLALLAFLELARHGASRSLPHSFPFSRSAPTTPRWMRQCGSEYFPMSKAWRFQWCSRNGATTFRH